MIKSLVQGQTAWEVSESDSNPGCESLETSLPCPHRLFADVVPQGGGLGKQTT